MIKENLLCIEVSGLQKKAQLAVLLSMFGVIVFGLICFILSEMPANNALSADAGSFISSVQAGNNSETAQASQSNTASQTAGKININTATWEELTELDGIGEVLAKRIIAYREENGIFTKPEQLINVTGIGEKKLAAVIDDITVS